MSDHLGTAWRTSSLTDLADRASHPCAILHGPAMSVFAKLERGPDAAARVHAELTGSRLLAEAGAVMVPRPLAEQGVPVTGGVLMLTEAVAEIPAAQRSEADWRALGTALGELHLRTANPAGDRDRLGGNRFGLDLDGWFGPLRQHNRPTATWAEFYAERRLRPLLRDAVDSGSLPSGLASGVDRVIDRLGKLAGPEPEPVLLHGDAQQNNLLATPDGAVLVDACPYYGHPEIDLALIDYFEPVPGAVLEGYREVHPIAEGFAERRELWRLHGYLAVAVVDGGTSFGRRMLQRLADATRALA